MKRRPESSEAPAQALILGLVLGFAMAGCGTQPEPEFADWVLPVPDGVPIKEYVRTSLEDRTEVAFELVEDLVIGGDSGDPNMAFYRPIAVVAADNGNIFVVESGARRVQMFSPEGEFLKTLGKEGQGPGEFQRPMQATIAGDRLVVFDGLGRRLSIWTDDGEHVVDQGLPVTSMPSRLAGLPDGRLVAVSQEIDFASVDPAAMAAGTMPPTTSVLGVYGTEYEQLERLVEIENRPLPSPDEMNDLRARTQSMIDRMAAPRLTFTGGGGQPIYATSSVEYQILAMDPDGEVSWALRVAGERRPIRKSSKELRIRSLARDEPDVTVDDFQWPDLDRAISGSILSDGHGRLYVSPLFDRPEGEEDGEGPAVPESEGSPDAPVGRPVDVYSPDGDLIVAGRANGTWSYARGDYVYHLRSDPDSEEILAVRYRLLLAGRDLP